MNKGISFAFAAALISGVAVFFNKFAVSGWSDSSVFTTAKNLVAVVFLVSLVLLLKKWGELKKLSKKQWLQLVIIGLIGGSVPFLLFFKGLSLSSATGAAFIHKTLFVWVAVLAFPFLKEKISVLQFVALAALLAGVYLFSPVGSFRFGYPELLIFIATLLWAVENLIAKMALRKMPALIAGAGRMFFGSIFLLFYLSATGGVSAVFDFESAKFGWLILSGAILFGYVATWYSALKFAPATVVSSILVLAAPVTAFLDSVFVTHGFKTDLIFPVLLILFGVLFVSNLYERFASFFQVRFAA